MQITTIGLDLAKHVFQVHGIDAEDKVVVRKQLRRSGVIAFFEKLPSCLIGIEACASAHYWARSTSRPRPPESRDRRILQAAKGGPAYLVKHDQDSHLIGDLNPARRARLPKQGSFTGADPSQPPQASNFGGLRSLGRPEIPAPVNADSVLHPSPMLAT